MKKVYVDASDRDKLITIVVDGEHKARRYSTLSYGKYFVETHEAEYLAIICALEEFSEDLDILSDSQSIVNILNKKSKARSKVEFYVTWIRELCEGRLVKFSYSNRDFNEASLKQEGFSLLEIRNEKLKEIMMEIKRRKRRYTSQ